MRRSSLARLAAGCALALSFPSVILAQQTGAATPQGIARTDPGVKKTLGFADIGRWNRINSATLSNDGKWITYVYQPNEGDGTLYVRPFAGGKTYTIPVGSAPVFSDDSRYVGYFVSPPESASRAGRGARGGGGRGGRGGTAEGDDTPSRRFELLDLASGTTYEVPGAATFKFSKGSKFVAIHTRPATGAKTKGADLLLRELATGITQNIGNVNLYDFDDDGGILAYTVDAADRIGNGIYAIDLATNQSKVLSSGAADYDQLTWSGTGTSLAVLRGDKKKENTQRDNTLLVWKDATAAASHAVEYDPSKDATFPKGYVVSELGALRWTPDASRLFVGLKAQSEATPPSTGPKANVDVWHWKDAEIQSVQMVRLAAARRATLTAAFDPSSDKLVQLADTVMPNVTPTADSHWAIGRIDTTYRGEVAWGGSRADYYRVNTVTGERSLIDTGLTRTMGSSPDGHWFLYLKNGQVYSYDVRSGKRTQLAANDKVSFVDETDDHPYEKPIYGVAGWSKDGKSVILDHRYDLWKVPLDGGHAVNLTNGSGEAQQIQFRLVRLDQPARGRGGRGAFAAASDDEDQGIDLSKPLLLSAYGEWTKKSGYYTLAPGGTPKPLIYDDEMIGQAQKAKNADRVIFTRQTFSESPDYWTSTTSFASPTKVTDANPFLGEYAWGKRILVDFKDRKSVV